MKKQYGYVLIAYIIMQLSSIIGIPVLYYLGVNWFNQSSERAEAIVPGYWLVISFSITLLVVWAILRKSETTTRLEREAPMSAGVSTFWAIAGIFMAFFAQSIAINIETLIGIEMGSENTKTIVNIIDTVPLAMIVAAVIGPILEEIVFRKIIFGVLYQRFSFIISALISSVIFAFAHFEPEHVLLYSAMGFTFAFLYVKTKRIIVPIIAHVSMNSLVVLMQSIFREDIERMIEEAERIQGFIGGLFL
ncbi:CPBP family intramembrane glutamic endopeptidase [Bacillus salacetis]|uniref:CPBP family intramembrane glutamic endopeptidase n=1 Tax=Bacillus salacetis TaxID=2315464 RepID=UPI003BA265CC